MHYAESVWINVIRVKQIQKKTVDYSLRNVIQEKKKHTHYFLERILERKKVS